MKKPAIPNTLTVKDVAISTVLRPIKENIEILTGVREGALQTLPSDASLTDAVSKINEIIRRLNFNE